MDEALSAMIDKAIEVLNRAVKQDAQAMTYLMEYRVQVNDGLADDPTIQVLDYTDIVQKGPMGLERKTPVLGTLGLINGIFGIREDGWGYITMVADDTTGLILRFQRTRDYSEESELQEE